MYQYITPKVHKIPFEYESYKFEIGERSLQSKLRLLLGLRITISVWILSLYRGGGNLGSLKPICKLLDGEFLRDVNEIALN